MKTRKASQGITLLCVSGPIPVLIQRRWQEKARTHPTSKCFFCWVSAAPAPQPPRNEQRRQTAAGRKGCPYHRSRTDRQTDTEPPGPYLAVATGAPGHGCRCLAARSPPRAASQGGGGAEEASPRPRRLRAGSEGEARLGAPAKGPCPAPCTQSQAQTPPRQPTRRSNRVRAHHLHVKLPTSIKSPSN